MDIRAIKLASTSRCFRTSEQSAGPKSNDGTAMQTDSSSLGQGIVNGVTHAHGHINSPSQDFSQNPDDDKREKPKPWWKAVLASALSLPGIIFSWLGFEIFSGKGPIGKIIGTACGFLVAMGYISSEKILLEKADHWLRRNVTNPVLAALGELSLVNFSALLMSIISLLKTISIISLGEASPELRQKKNSVNQLLNWLEFDPVHLNRKSTDTWEHILRALSKTAHGLGIKDLDLVEPIREEKSSLQIFGKLPSLAEKFSSEITKQKKDLPVINRVGLRALSYGFSYSSRLLGMEQWAKSGQFNSKVLMRDILPKLPYIMLPLVGFHYILKMFRKRVLTALPKDDALSNQFEMAVSKKDSDESRG